MVMDRTGLDRRSFIANALLAIGAADAGATQELRYRHTPGAWEPSLPVTAHKSADAGKATLCASTPVGGRSRAIAQSRAENFTAVLLDLAAGQSSRLECNRTYALSIHPRFGQTGKILSVRFS
jgi:hypothetical protein